MYMPFTETELEEYLNKYFTNSPATNHLEKYNPSTTIDVLDKKAFDSIKDIEPIDTDITFTYLENDILSNNIEYQRDYLKSYDMHLCLYNVDASLRLPFLKYFFIIENNKRKFYTKSMDMRQFIDINENKHAIPPTDDDQDDDDQDISEIDQEFIRQITEFAKEKLRDDLDITNKYKGFIEDDNNNIFIFIEIENQFDIRDNNKHKIAILDEIINNNMITNEPIDPTIVSLFQKHEFIQNLRTKENIRVQFPKITYICNQNDSGLVQNMFVDENARTKILIYPTINYNEYGDIYTFSTIPITLENIDNIRRYACFIENQSIDEDEDENDSGNVSFQENDVQFYGLYDDDVFTELD